MSPLTSLPVEIRLTIFHHVLSPYSTNDFAPPPKHTQPLTVHPRSDEPYETPGNSPRRFWGSKQMADLLVLNRLIYSELRDLIYNNGHFVIDMKASQITPAAPSQSLIVSPYVSRLAPDLRRTVRHLDVRVPLYIRSLRPDSLKMCQEAHLLFPSLRSVVIRVMHISFTSNPLRMFLQKMLCPLLEAFKGVNSIWLHCHETRFFQWGANNRTLVPGASPNGEHATAKFDTLESWVNFTILPGGAKLYRSSMGKTNPRFDKLLDGDAFAKIHERPRPSVLQYGSIPDRECEGVEIAFRSAQTDRAMQDVETRKSRRRVRF